MVKKIKFEIEGRRWRDKTYGNTYHTATVTKYDSKGKVAFSETSPVSYGYGDQYQETGFKLLKSKDKGFAKRNKNESMYYYGIKDKEKIETSVRDVDRKRDL